MERNIHYVIDQIIQEIPADFDQSENLKERLTKISREAYFIAPECMWYKWQKLMVTLQNALGVLDSDWKKKIKLIATGETNENDK